MYKDSIAKFIFGNYDPFTKNSSWITTSNKIKNEFSLSNKRGPVKIFGTILSINTINRVKDTSVIVITQNAPSNYNCHTCSPLLGIYFFRKSFDNVWRMNYRALFSQLRSQGEAPAFEVKTDNLLNSYVTFKTGETLQGITFQNFDVYSFVGSQFKRVLLVENVAGDNRGSCTEAEGNCWAYTSVMKYIISDGKKLSDIIIITNGKKENDEGKIVAVNFEVKYIFSGNKYILFK